MRFATSTAAAALLFVGLGLGTAQAADVYHQGGMKDEGGSNVPGTSVNWTGFYFGGQVGLSNSKHDLRSSETVDAGTCDFPETGPSKAETDSLTYQEACKAQGGTWVSKPIELASAFLDGVNSYGVFGGGTLGGDIQRGRFVFGVFGDYNFSGAEATAGATLGVCPACFEANASIEDGDSWVVAARAGYLFGQDKRAMLYILGGYGQQDVSYAVGTSDPEDGGKKDLTFSGFVVGAGGEYALTNNLFFGIEWQHFFGGKEDLINETSEDGLLNSKLTDELDTDKVMAKLKYKLNGDLPRFND